MKILKIFLFFLIFLSLPANAEENRMTLSTRSGEQIDFNLSEKPYLSFEDNELRIRSRSFDFQLPLKEVKNIYYQLNSSEEGGIDSMELSPFELSFTDEYILVKAKDKSLDLNLYSGGGSQFTNVKIYPNEIYSLPIYNLPKGVYILKINNESHKFWKK